jgi:GT2 family glycosyltransferase
MKSVCIAILNYNGSRYLKDLLPSIESALRVYPEKCNALILDNSPDNQDRLWLKANYPSIKVIKAPRNNYLFSYNWLLPQLCEDIVILLNNDLKVSEDFIQPLVQHFESEDVFAVSATSMDWEGKKYTCGPAFLSQEYTLYRWGYDCSCQRVSHTLYASGGFSAFDRKKFLQLGGFSPLFYPAYGEDLDLGFRAWRQGWRCIFEPRSIVYHYNQGSWGREQSQKVAKINYRAELLFVWSSLPPIGNWVQRFLMTLWVFYLNFCNGKSWCISLWLKTYLEWIFKYRQYNHFKISHRELNLLKKKICQNLL